MSRFIHELPFGATVLDGGPTRFRIWAPDCDVVMLEIEGRDPIEMAAAAEGWFETDAPAGHGTPYMFRPAGKAAVPDPAARAQAGGVHGQSLVVDPGAYRWRHPDWSGRPWHEAVILEVHAGCWGGYRGVAAQLPRLADLGITAIELMPVAEFPGDRNWGYDGVLPFAPESSYGTPEELKALIDDAHGLGLMMFLDVVYNHFGPDGNYLGSYASPFFRGDLDTPWGPAIDFRLPQVRGYFTQNAIYWLKEYRFDGLRFDAVHAISEPDWLDEMAAHVRASIEPDRHVHLVLEHDENAARHLTPGLFDAQWNDDGHHTLHTILTGERDGYYADYADRPAERLARVLSEGFAYQGEPSTYRDGARRGEPSAHLSPTSFVLFLQNHDQIGNRAHGERLTSLASPQAVEAATALLLLSPQIPLLFMGEEWGTTRPFLYFTSHEPELAEAVREGRRQEFAGFGRFSDPEERARIPDPNAFETFEMSRPLPEEAESEPCSGRLELVHRLLAIRNREIAPRLSGARAVGAQAIGKTAVAAQWRLADGSILAIAANLGGGPVQASVPAGGDCIFESHSGAVDELRGGTLAAHTAVALLEMGA